MSNVFRDFEDHRWDVNLDDDNRTYSITRDILNELCTKVMAAEEEILKAWFEMAFNAGKDYEDLPFETWWRNFYATIQQAAEKT